MVCFFFLFFPQKRSSPHSLQTWCLLGGRQAQQFASLISKAPWEKIFTILCLTFFFLAFLLLRVNGKGGQDLMVQSSHGSRRAYFTQMQVGQKCAFRTHLLAFILWNRCAVIWLKNRKRRMCVCVGRKKKRVFKKKKIEWILFGLFCWLSSRR